MSSGNTGQKNLAKYKKRKLKLSLYSSKAERKYRRFVLPTKRKNSSGQPNLPLKLARLETEGSSSLESGEKTSGVSEGNIGEHSIDILHDGALVEGADLSNPIPTNIDQSQESDQIFTNLKDHARRILTDKSLLDSLIDKLYDNDLLLHYIAHFEEISYGRLSPMNVAVLFGLERAYWQTLHSTTNMVYKDVTKRWYAICERLFGGSYINLCSGSKNFGQVISLKTKRGKYDPNKSKINFAVPHRRHLYAISKHFPKIIKPGIIHEAMDLVANRTDLVLMVDCKRVARGLEDDFLGDVDLFGYEEPKISHLKEIAERECDFLHRLKEEFDNMAHENRYDAICKCIAIICKRIEQVRSKQQLQKWQLAKYEKRVENSNSKKEQQDLQFPISKLKTWIYLSFLWIKKCMVCISGWCRLNSFLLGTDKILKLTGSVVLANESNVRLLHEAHHLARFIDFNVHPQYVKQRSEHWMHLRKQSLITGSTIYSALGFRGTEEMKLHFREFVLKEHDRIFDDETIQRMQYGTDNEVIRYRPQSIK